MSSTSRSEERESIKASLKQWWTNFTKSGIGGSGGSSSGGSGRSGKDRASRGFTLSPTSATSSGSAPGSAGTDRVFGEPLRTSLRYASVAISMADDEGKQYIWGYVPVVVAKVGLFLKENATEVEGVFRIAGSQKRMRELQETFDMPPKYGKQLTWERYSVHDAASVLRRYLNKMPEPIVPLQLYNEFRNAMRKQPVDVDAATRTYRLLIQSMPPANRYLLLYVLDLLAVFARKSEQNRMPASNLAVIFQPGIFSHPSHLQDANEHKAAVEVLEFLIVHQDHFVLGISPPPPTNVGPSELTQVSLPPPEERPDVADLSESDEELGDLVVHEGGGAALAKRRSSEASTSKKSGKGGALGIFRSRSLRRNSRSSAASPEISDAVANAGRARRESLNFESERTPAMAEGEIHEVGLEKDNEPLQIVAAQVRRSRTVPGGKRRKEKEGALAEEADDELEGSENVASGSTLEAPAMAKSATLEPLKTMQAPAMAKSATADSPASPKATSSSTAGQSPRVRQTSGSPDKSPAKDGGSQQKTTQPSRAQPSGEGAAVETSETARATGIPAAAEEAETAASDLPTPPSSKLVERTEPATEKPAGTSTEAS